MHRKGVISYVRSSQNSLSKNIALENLQKEFNKLTQDLKKFNQNILSPKIDHFQHLSKFARKVI